MLPKLQGEWGLKVSKDDRELGVQGKTCLRKINILIRRAKRRDSLRKKIM